DVAGQRSARLLISVDQDSEWSVGVRTGSPGSLVDAGWQTVADMWLPGYTSDGAADRAVSR
ncbi:MAG: hypothetical protein ABR528_11785, partial [Pseudonocardiaceae bacterium]